MTRAAKTLALFALFAVLVTLGRGYLETHNANSSSTTSTTASTTTSSVVSSTTTSSTLPHTTCSGTNFVSAWSLGASQTGQVSGVVTLTPTGAVHCVVDGYPLVTLQSPTASLINVSFSHTGQPQPVVLAGTEALEYSFIYSNVAANNETCPQVAQINTQFLGGGTSVAATLSFPISPCGTIVLSPWKAASTH